MIDTGLAAAFEEQRPRLRSIAFRMLGTHNDAEDAVQEAWLRLQRTDAAAVDNLAGWLTVVVSRVCLDQLRSRGSHREDPYDELPAASEARAVDPTPEDVSVQADSVGAALLIILEVLSPAERLAFVLHDLFGLSFEEIAPIVGKSAVASRQLASRARRRIRGVEATREQNRQREVVAAFLAASREGDFGRLLQVLDPDVELRAAPQTVQVANANADHGAPLLGERLVGADAVARAFAGRATAARPATIDGVPGAAWAPRGRARTVFAMQVRDGRIVRIEVIAEADQLADLEIILS